MICTWKATDQFPSLSTSSIGIYRYDTYPFVRGENRTRNTYMYPDHHTGNNIQIIKIMKVSNE